MQVQHLFSCGPASTPRRCNLFGVGEWSCQYEQLSHTLLRVLVLVQMLPNQSGGSLEAAVADMRAQLRLGVAAAERALTAAGPGAGGAPREPLITISTGDMLTTDPCCQVGRGNLCLPPAKDHGRILFAAGAPACHGSRQAVLAAAWSMHLRPRNRDSQPGSAMGDTTRGDAPSGS